jgi:hypothetical protein
MFRWTLGKILSGRMRGDFAISASPFYRKYPFKGKVRLSSADRRGVVDFEMGFFYNRVPKAANTTIMANLAALKKGTGAQSGQDDLRSIFSQTPAWLREDQMRGFEQLFKFTFVRNPYSRVLSAYLDKIVKDIEPGRRKKMGMPASGGIPSFKDFVEWLGRSGLHKDIHWAPQSSILVIPVHKFDFIGRIENLEEDFRMVTGRLDTEQHMRSNSNFQTRSPHATGASDKESEYYSEELRRIVAGLYKDDFEAFGYEA